MKIKIGDFIEVKGKLTPGVVVRMYVRDILYSITEIDTDAEYAKIIDFIIARKGSSSLKYTIDDIVKPISQERYEYLRSLGEELLKSLWWCWKKCESIYTWEEFTRLYYYNQNEVMPWIPVRRVIHRKIVEFADNSIWLCDKLKYKDSRRRSKGKSKKHHIYIPKKLLYDNRI